MSVNFSKYQALGNDFILIDNESIKKNKKSIGKLAEKICDRNTGIGADGIILLSKSQELDGIVDIFNADGSWAEKSGNGLRIAGLHFYLKNKKRKEFLFESNGIINKVKIIKPDTSSVLIWSELGEPIFDSKKIPVKTSNDFMLNASLKVGSVTFPVTCLSLGNPHAVLFVDNFNFDWQSLGFDIENHKIFPNRTNVEFVKILTRKKIKVFVWERGAGPTSSSGTGATASVAAGVMLGQLDRECEVQFESGHLNVNWRSTDNIIELTGPVEFICMGDYNF